MFVSLGICVEFVEILHYLKKKHHLAICRGVGGGVVTNTKKNLDTALVLKGHPLMFSDFYYSLFYYIIVSYSLYI